MKPIEVRISEAVTELDFQLANGVPVARGISEVAKTSGLTAHVVRLRGEKALGPLAERKRWHAKKVKARNSVNEFLHGYSINSNNERLQDVMYYYEIFFRDSFGRRPKTQDLALVDGVIKLAYLKDFEIREADRRARGVRLVGGW